MKPTMITGVILLVVATGQASADCSSGQIVDPTTLQSVLEGNTACAMRGSDAWQEEHHSGDVANGAPLWDYKMGDGDAIDPRKQVGTWKIEGTGSGTKVTYTYPKDPDGPYSYTVHDTGDHIHYTFCGADTIDVRMATGSNVGCGFPPP